MNQKIGIAVNTENDNGLANDVIGKEALPGKIEKRKELNLEGIEDVARHIEKNGSFADENWNW